MFNGSCYLFASYPEVSWHTARSICNGIKVPTTVLLLLIYRREKAWLSKTFFKFLRICVVPFEKAELTSIHNAEEEQFVESFIRESTDSRSAIYWLGGAWNDKSWYWVDNSTETFSGLSSSCLRFRYNLKKKM